MPRLLIKNFQGSSREIELRPGINRIGRNADNDHPLDDPSISRYHCEIYVTENATVVKDLGSSNGTFINAQPVQEGKLFNGQWLRLGSVELIYNDEGGQGTAVLPPIAGPVVKPQVRVAVARAVSQTAETQERAAAGSDDCAQHPGIQARFICQKCENQFCPACVKEIKAGVRSFYSCPVCEGTCVPLNTYRQAAAQERASFFSLVPGAFGYPFKRDGLILLIAGAIFFSVLQWAGNIARYAFLLGFGAMMILTVTSVGYLFSFMRNIIVTTVNGDDAPSWPEVNSFAESMIIPFFQFLSLWLVCLGPGLAVMIWVSQIAGLGVMLFGLFCVPMALLTVSMVDSVSGLNPFIIISSIGKAPGAYLLACGIFLFVLAVSTGINYLVEYIPIPLLPTLVLHGVTLYGLAVEMRIMGLFYHKYRERLAWFS